MRRGPALVVVQELRETVEADADVLDDEGVVRDAVTVVPYLLQRDIRQCPSRLSLTTYEKAVVRTLQLREADLRATRVGRPLLLRSATPYETRPLLSLARLHCRCQENVQSPFFDFMVE